MSVSIGDVLLLSKIAFRIGQAFTSGRKAAPAEFSEIQSLLFTMSKSLELLVQKQSDSSSNAQPFQKETDTDQILAQMIINCKDTLVPLEELVKKYSDIEPDKEGIEKRHWKDDIRKNWKQVVWTKEGGNLAKLKTTLTAHLNGLQLALLATNR